MNKPLHVHIGSLNLNDMSKCEILRELSGYNGCDHRGVTCEECRKHQQEGLRDRILNEYKPKGKR